MIHFKEKLLKLTKKGPSLFSESTIEKSLISKCAICMQGLGGNKNTELFPIVAYKLY